MTRNKAEAHELMKRAQQLKTAQEDTNDVSEDDIAALLKQLGEDNNNFLEHTSSEEKDTSEAHATADAKVQRDQDDVAEIETTLSQLRDAARLEQKFDSVVDPDTESSFPSVPRSIFPSVPKDAHSGDDELSTRLANLKTFQPKTYTGIDRGSINVFVPGIAKTEEDETTHWCGMSFGFC